MGSILSLSPLSVSPKLARPRPPVTAPPANVTLAAPPTTAVAFPVTMPINGRQLLQIPGKRSGPAGKG